MRGVERVRMKVKVGWRWEEPYSTLLYSVRWLSHTSTLSRCSVFSIIFTFFRLPVFYLSLDFCLYATPCHALPCHAIVGALSYSTHCAVLYCAALCSCISLNASYLISLSFPLLFSPATADCSESQALIQTISLRGS